MYYKYIIINNIYLLNLFIIIIIIISINIIFLLIFCVAPLTSPHLGDIGLLDVDDACFFFASFLPNTSSIILRGTSD